MYWSSNQYYCKETKMWRERTFLSFEWSFSPKKDQDGTLLMTMIDSQRCYKGTIISSSRERGVNGPCYEMGSDILISSGQMFLVLSGAHENFTNDISGTRGGTAQQHSQDSLS